MPRAITRNYPQRRAAIRTASLAMSPLSSDDCGIVRASVEWRREDSAVREVAQRSRAARLFIAKSSSRPIRPRSPTYHWYYQPRGSSILPRGLHHTHRYVRQHKELHHLFTFTPYPTLGGGSVLGGLGSAGCSSGRNPHQTLGPKGVAEWVLRSRFDACESFSPP